MMFVGHYAAAMVAKAAEPKTPLWSLFLATQLVDLGWSGLVAVGVERVRVDPSLPGSPLDLYDMPWTHSLPAAVLWSIGGAIVFAAGLKLTRRAAVVFGLTVFSHWLLDLLVHRPDLALWIGGPKVGLALWNAPVVEQAVEMGLVGLGAVVWSAHRVRASEAAWPVGALLAFLVFMQIAVIVAPGGAGAVQLGVSAAVVYAVIAFAAALTERRKVRRLAPERAGLAGPAPAG